MHDRTAQYDYVNAELEYRLARARAGLAGRRARRRHTRQGIEAGWSDAGDTTFTTAR